MRKEERDWITIRIYENIVYPSSLSPSESLFFAHEQSFMLLSKQVCTNQVLIICTLTILVTTDLFKYINQFTKNKKMHLGYMLHE